MDTVSGTQHGEPDQIIFGYPLDFRMKNVLRQAHALHEYFPSVGFADEAKEMSVLPQGADGWSVFFGWQRIAGTYHEAVDLVLQAITESRGGKFVNFLVGGLGPERLRQEQASSHFFTQLDREQDSFGCLVAPAQFGVLHRNRSVVDVCSTLPVNECGLSIFEVALMILANPQRFQRKEDLWVSCPGSRWNDPHSPTCFDKVPYFHFNGCTLALHAKDISEARPFSGSATGFLVS